MYESSSFINSLIKSNHLDLFLRFISCFGAGVLNFLIFKISSIIFFVDLTSLSLSSLVHQSIIPKPPKSFDFSSVLQTEDNSPIIFLYFSWFSGIESSLNNSSDFSLIGYNF